MMSSKAIDYSINLLTLLAVVIAAAGSGYRIWHNGLHRSTPAERVEMPRLNAGYYADAPLGTYVITFSERNAACRDQLRFYQRFAAAVRKAKRPAKAILVYPKQDKETPMFLHDHNVDLPGVVASDQVKRIPAIYLLDALGVVRGYWNGSLRDYDEKRLLQAF